MRRGPTVLVRQRALQKAGNRRPSRSGQLAPKRCGLRRALRRSKPRAARRNGIGLNKGGDRQGNNALWTIANNRLIHHPETRAYAARRSAEGLSRREILAA